MPGKNFHSVFSGFFLLLGSFSTGLSKRFHYQLEDEIQSVVRKSCTRDGVVVLVPI